MQRVSLVVSVLVLAGAALGIFGEGPISRRHLAVDGARIEFEQFQRQYRAATIRIELSENSPADFAIELSGSICARSEFVSVSPRPVRQETRANGMRLVFASTSEAAGRLVLLRMKPEAAGALSGTLTVAGHSVPIGVFVWP
ncbi:MAG: hypothetical protein AB7G11_05420 [Phycisphaerales bacterium]